MNDIKQTCPCCSKECDISTVSKGKQGAEDMENLLSCQYCGSVLKWTGSELEVVFQSQNLPEEGGSAGSASLADKTTGATPPSEEGGSAGSATLAGKTTEVASPSAGTASLADKTTGATPPSEEEKGSATLADKTTEIASPSEEEKGSATLADKTTEIASPLEQNSEPTSLSPEPPVPPADPAPADTAPADPAPADPAPADPAPADPAPADPAPADPAPADPAPPTIEEPLSAEPLSAEPPSAEPLSADLAPAEPPSAEPPPANFKDVEQYGNAPASSEKGFLRYDLHIAGLDSKEIEKEVFLVLDDPRFNWSAKEILQSQKDGVLEIKNLNPVKAMCLVSELSTVSVQLSWKQYMALDVLSESSEETAEDSPEESMN